MRKIWLITFAVLFVGCHKSAINKTAAERLALDKQAGTLPSLYLTIDSEMLDSIHHTQKVKATAEAYLVTAENDTLYEGDIKIKTRGNSTFAKPEFANKKSYSIKFPKRTQILGLENDRSYNLLANYTDGTRYLSNPFAFDLARIVGLPAPKYTHLHLYCNGVYKGIYQITNKTDAIPQTVSITDLSKENKILNPYKQSSYPHFPAENEEQLVTRRGVYLDENPEDISGGYLIEHCYTGRVPYLKSPSGFMSDQGETFRIRSPKYASFEEVEYIADFYNQLEGAIYSPTGYNPTTGKHYSQYIDVESFAKYYIIQELMPHCDAGNNSFFMYKDVDSVDSLLYAGPVWDLDLYSFSNPLSTQCYNTLYVSAWNREKGGMYYYLWQHSDFRDEVVRAYTREVYPQVKDILQSNYMDSLQNVLNVQLPEFKEALQKRSDFLYWLWTADSSDIVCVQIVNQFAYAVDFLDGRSKINLYGSTSEGIRLPQFPIINNGDPTITWHLVGDSVPLPADTIFYTNQNVEIRLKYPSKLEVQRRRIKKKLRKVFSRAQNTPNLL